MIAFYQELEEVAVTKEIRRARQLVAKTLLSPEEVRSKNRPGISGWKCWMFVLWVAAVTTYYFICMALGL